MVADGAMSRHLAGIACALADPNLLVRGAAQRRRLADDLDPDRLGHPPADPGMVRLAHRQRLDSLGPRRAAIVAAILSVNGSASPSVDAPTFGNQAAASLMSAITGRWSDAIPASPVRNAKTLECPRW